MFKEIPKITNIESFLSKIKISNDSECWIWDGNIYKDGYGRIGISYKSYQAHRVSHDIFNGFKDHNMLIDHKCRNRSCVNPEHLREVTCKINSIENSIGITAKNNTKTHCSRGHEFTKENTYIYKRGSRSCWICIRLHRNGEI